MLCIKEGLDEPSVLIEHGHFHGLEFEIVGQKDQCPARFTVMVLYAPELFRVVLGRIEPGKSDRLVTFQSLRLVDLCGIHPLEFHVLLCPDQKICAGPVYPVKSFKVEVAPVHYIKGTCQEDDHVEYVDIVHLAVRYMYEIGDRVLRVHFRVHLYRGLGLAELRPGIKARAEVDGRGVDDEDVVLYIDLELAAALIKFLRPGYERKRKVPIDPPVPFFVRPAQGRFAYCPADTEMVQFFGIGTDAHYRVGQAFPMGQLAEGHTKELVPTAKVTGLSVAIVLFDELQKVVVRNELEYLGKDIFS